MARRHNCSDECGERDCADQHHGDRSEEPAREREPQRDPSRSASRNRKRCTAGIGTGEHAESSGKVAYPQRANLR